MNIYITFLLTFTTVDNTDVTCGTAPLSFKTDTEMNIVVTQFQSESLFIYIYYVCSLSGS